MAKNILNFTPTSAVEGGDLFHLGRDANSSPADKDMAILGEDLFASMNIQAALLGTPSVSGNNLVSGVRKTLVNYGTPAGSAGSINDADGSITITKNAVYRVNVNLIATADNDNGFNIGLFLVWGSGEVSLSGSAIASRADAGDIINLAGGTLIALTIDDVLTLQVEAGAGIDPLTFPNGTFEIQPIALV